MRELSFFALPVILSLVSWYFYHRILASRSLEISTGSARDAKESTQESGSQTNLYGKVLETSLGFACLTGRLDGVALLDGQRVPLVIGPSRPGRKLSRALCMKCVASALLMEAALENSSVQSVLIQYENGMRFPATVTEAMRRDFLREMKILSESRGGESPRSHCSVEKCIRCPYSPICSEAIRPTTPWAAANLE